MAGNPGFDLFRLSEEHDALREAVTIDAVRFLLKGVYRKTGAENQAQLMTLVTQVPQG